MQGPRERDFTKRREGDSLLFVLRSFRRSENPAMSASRLASEANERRNQTMEHSSHIDTILILKFGK